MAYRLTSTARKNRVCGSFPRTLYRCFTNEEHARQFVEEGRLRVGLLDTYKSIECAARRDPSEGVGLYKLKGQVISGRFSANPEIEPEWFASDGVQLHNVEHLTPKFLLCCINASADIALLKIRFGKYVVRIDSPVGLATEIDHALNGFDGNAGPFLVEGRDVEYNKGDLVEDGRTEEKLCDLAYVQKPAEFSDEKEFRFCLMATGIKSQEAVANLAHLEIDLGTGKKTFAAMV